MPQASRAPEPRRSPTAGTLRRRVADHASAIEGDHPIREAQAPLEPVLGEQDRHVGILVHPPQQPDQLIAGNRVQLRCGLVEDQKSAACRRAPRRARLAEAPRRTARQSCGPGGARSRATAPLPRLPWRPPRRAGPGSPGRTPAQPAPCPSRSASRGPGTAFRAPPPARRAVVARIHAGDHRPPGERAAMEVRGQAAGDAQQRRLARARPPGHDHQLAWVDLQAHPAERRRYGAGVAYETSWSSSTGAVTARSPGGRRTGPGRRRRSPARLRLSAPPAGACSDGYAWNGAHPAKREATAIARTATADAANARSWRDHGRR